MAHEVDRSGIRSRSRTRLLSWAVRSAVLFLAVYVLGLLRVPTLIPYIAGLLVVVADLARSLRAGRGAESPRRPMGNN